MAASRADPPSAIHMLDVTYDAATRREATPPANGSMAAKTEQEGRIVAVKAVQGIGLLDKENRWASRDLRATSDPAEGSYRVIGGISACL